jgi:signal transduction histidine kinase
VAVLERTDGTAQISVSDNGPGIADSEKTKVVERFYRGDASRGTPGVGLGLSLVQAVAKLHGSTLELSDQNPGLRAAVTIHLDARASALATSHQETAAGDVVGSPTLASSA